jgi:Mrp family chromosome partitioning ATPase
VAPGTPERPAGSTVERLGRAFADAGSDVLLVDADLNHPSLHERFQLPLEAGVAGALAQLADRRDVTASTLLESAETVAEDAGQRGRLAVLTSGAPTWEPDRLLRVDALLKLAAALRASKADCVLVQLPPPLQAPEALILAREADALILALAPEAMRHDDAVELAEAIDQLEVPTAIAALHGRPRDSRLRAPRAVATRVAGRRRLATRGLPPARPAADIEPAQNAERAG